MLATSLALEGLPPPSARATFYFIEIYLLAFELGQSLFHSRLSSISSMESLFFVWRSLKMPMLIPHKLAKFFRLKYPLQSVELLW